MGYFGALTKCARNSAGWTGWAALSGADYVAPCDKCVVYRATANYDSADSSIAAFGIGTNFVSPLSTKNPSTACCYLYTSDPTGGLNAAVNAPPGGYIAMAGPLSFEASNVGNYITFPFPALSGAPDTLYFWFTSSAQYSAYSSNQIYHYATGNWNDTLQTGTKHPAIYGGLSGQISSGGSGSGGTVEVELSIKDFAAQYNLPQTERSFTMSLNKGEIGRMPISFAYSVQTDIVVTTTGDTQLSKLFLSDQPEVYMDTGRPVSILREFSAEGYSSAVRVEKDKVYYVFAICSGAAYAGSVAFTISPPAPKWSEGDRAQYYAMEETKTRTVSLSTGKYSVIEMSFAHSGTVSVSTADSTLTQGLFIIGYLSPNDKIDVSYGEAVDYIRYASGESGAPDYIFTYAVESGQVYYLVTRNVSADDALTTAITIVPPEKKPEARIYLSGEMKRANCCIYADGAWRETEPYIFSRGGWHAAI